MNKEAGTTIIEALLTIAFLGISAAGILVLFGGSTASALKADQTVVATNLAREVLEEIISDRANKGYVFVLSKGAGSYCMGSFGGNFSNYTCSATFQEVAAPVAPDGDNFDDFATSQPSSGYLRTEVTVSWNGGNDNIRIVSLITDWTL